MARNEIDKLIRSKRKSIGLQIRPDATLIVRAPVWAKTDDIERVVAKHREWIRKKKEEILRDQKCSKPRQYIEGEEFPYLGQSYKIHISDDPNIILRFDDAFYLSEGFQSAFKGAFIQWYKCQAKKVIAQRVQLYAVKSNLKYGRIRITDARKRWGSCSSKGNLNFPWRLVMAPLAVIDYVVAHELSHIIVKNHSRRFWDKIGKIYPKYEKHRKWLRDNGRSLNL